MMVEGGTEFVSPLEMTPFGAELRFVRCNRLVQTGTLSLFATMNYGHIYVKSLESTRSIAAVTACG